MRRRAFGETLLLHSPPVDAIVAEGLEKRYGRVQALAGVTFSVREGEIFGLLGPNGGFSFSQQRSLASGAWSEMIPRLALPSSSLRRLTAFTLRLIPAMRLGGRVPTRPCSIPSSVT